MRLLRRCRPTRKQIARRAFGELDPGDPLNKIIQDIGLGKDSDGKVRYVATLVVTKPVDMAEASGLMWHDVPNCGRPLTISNIERGFGDVEIGQRVAGRQRQHARAGLGTAVRPTRRRGKAITGCTFRSQKNPDGSPVTGPVTGRIVIRSGPSTPAAVDHTDQPPARYAGEPRYVESDARHTRSRI